MTFKYDGYQQAPDGLGCHHITITDESSPAFGASICLDGPESITPPESEILARAAAKESEFQRKVVAQ